MTQYLELLAQQRPSQFASDGANRKMFSVNFKAMARGPVANFSREIGKLILTAGLATKYASSTGGDLIIGRDKPTPNGPGPFIRINDYGGPAPRETHNGDLYEIMMVQIVVVADTYEAAETRALAIWRELHGKRNFTVAA